MVWFNNPSDYTYYYNYPACQFDVTLDHVIDIGYLDEFAITYTHPITD